MSANNLNDERAGESAGELADETPEDANGATGKRSDVALKDEEDHSGTQQVHGTASGHGKKSSLQRLSTKNVPSEEQIINIEDVKRNITFSPSITETLNDMVSPLRGDFEITKVHVDKDQALLNQAINRLKADFGEQRAESELRNLYDLYNSSLVDNTILQNQCQELLEKVRQYEARHQWDPRVLKVLLIAERYRQEKAHVEDEKTELEAEVVDMTMELKHQEDITKNKNKDLSKMQDELKRGKELEKQLEQLEATIMKKDNEITSLLETYDALQLAYNRLEQIEKQNRRHSLQLHNPSGGGEEAKTRNHEHEMTSTIQHLSAEKLVLKHELDETKKVVNTAHRRIANLSVEISELENTRKIQLKQNAKVQSEYNILENSKAALERKMVCLRDELTITRSEAVTLKNTIEASNQRIAQGQHKIEACKKDHVAVGRQNTALQCKINHIAGDLKRCQDDKDLMRLESQVKDNDLLQGERSLAEKKRTCDKITAKLYKLEEFKARHLELIKLTRINTTNMVKEIAGLRASLIKEKTQLQKAENNLVRMQSQFESVHDEYMHVLENNMLLVRHQEMQSAALEQFEANKSATDRRIAFLMKTNIDLYTQTTSQQEFALIQTHQFHLKENEIKGLLSRLEEEHVKMNRLITKNKECRCNVEQLHAEANAREQKMKNYKSVIESYTQLNKSINDKAEELQAQLRSTHTQKELIRRQRDLFGMKLLQSRAETELSQEALVTARETMTKYSVDFYNMQNDIRVLKLEIKNLRRKLKLADIQGDMIHTLKQELGQATKALELQKCKNVILEETHMPKTHRWRGLLASDPSKYEMVLKTQLLIKRLIGKTKEVVRLEEAMKNKDMMYLSMWVLTRRRVNGNLAPEMCSARNVIRKQHRQLKSLTAELNMVQQEKFVAKQDKDDVMKTIKEVFVKEAKAKVQKPKFKTINPSPILPPLVPSVGRKEQQPHKPKST